MSDGHIIIDTKIDSSGIDSGISGVDKKVKTGAKSIAASFAKAGVAVAGVTAAIKIAADVVGDLTDAYKKQAKAETQLETAAKNNPYLNSSSVKALRNYASELQSISTTGDEELLPFMAQLAAAGRTQDEIMQIMSAALDMAASGAFSLDSAVRNLNKGFGGLSGELGEAIPEIKSLTAEQLRNGEHVKIMAARYKGLAASVAENTGTAEQMRNAFGDLKEEIGFTFEKTLAPVRNFFTKLVSGWAEAKKAQREYQQEAAAFIESQEIDKKTEKKIKNVLSYYTVAMREAHLAGNLEEVQRIIAQIAKDTGVSELAVVGIAAKYGMADDAVTGFAARLSEVTAEQERVDAATQAATAAQAAANKRNADAAAFIKLVNSERDAAIEKMRLQADLTGEELSQQDILNAYIDSYIRLVTESGGLVTANNSAAKELLATIRALTTEYKTQVENIDELKAALDEINTSSGQSQVEQMEAQLEALDILYNEAASNEEARLELEKEYGEKRAYLAQQIADAKKKIELENYQEIASIAADFASEYAGIMATIQELATKYIEDAATVRIQSAEEEYANGEISAEQYEKKVEEINKEAAEEKHKMDLWAWSANILNASANTALGFTKALGEGGAIGIITGALVAAAGAAQLATIIANKPIPPSFSTGGVVGGTSFSGDRVPVYVNSAERILTAQQNAAFEKMAYSGGGNNIKIINNASNDVNARAQINDRDIEIIIDRTVAKSMADGKYNSSYKQMQRGINGVRYIN